MRRLLFDTESNGLLSDASVLHCAAAADVDTREAMDWRPGDIPGFLDTLDKADVLIGHNIQRHDIPLITKLHGWRPRAGVLIRDTMICARVIYPNVKDTDKALVLSGKMPAGKKYAGKHTIAAWGCRLGEPKGDYAELMEDQWRQENADLIPTLTVEEIKRRIGEYVWGTWSEAMHTYMVQDVSTNLKLWDHLRVDKYSQEAIDLEHRIAFVCNEMEKAGVPFDLQAAQTLFAELKQKQHEIEQRLIETYGTWVAPVSPDKTKQVTVPKRKPNKNQNYFWWDAVPDETVVGDDGRKYRMVPAYCKLKSVQFNPGSRDHIARVLTQKGWKPERFTEGGKPQIDEETVAAIVERYPDMAGLGELLTVEKRISQLAGGKQAWLDAAREHDDGISYIHGVINPMGTGTSRASHFNPNLGQVPAVKSPYGKECRSLFYAPKGWKIVGADQQGLELRGLAHYLALTDGGKYGRIVLEGDPHWAHAIAMGLADGERDKHSQLHTIIREDGSKRFIYAYIYGCGDGKAGEIIFGCVNKARLMCGTAGETVFARFFPDADPGERALKKAGKKVRNDFAQKIDGFSKLKNKLGEQVVKFGWVPGLDMRRIPIRSEHSALNYMIQSCGAIICKRWVCDTYDALVGRGLKHGWDGDFVLGLWVHDEQEIWCRDGLEKIVGDTLVECARNAGTPYGFRVPLDSEYKVGTNWSEVH